MIIEYDMPSNTLTVRWNRDHEGAQWRMCRSHIDALVDYANDPSAIRIFNASDVCPDLEHATVSFQTQLNIGGLCMRNRTHYQPQLPWDEILPAAPKTRCAHLCKSQRGICVYCGAIAQHRHAPCKKDGWGEHNICPRCSELPGDQWPRDWYTESMNEAAERIAARTYAFIHEPPTPAQIAAAAPVIEEEVYRSEPHHVRALPRRKQCKPSPRISAQPAAATGQNIKTSVMRDSATWLTQTSSNPAPPAETQSRRHTQSDSQRADR